MSTAETKVMDTAVPSSHSVSPRTNLKVELVERPGSPETNCAICLEELRNKSYTNTCLHQFCYHCLLEWSKVKPECPLCKQAFTRIYHNIRSNDDYDEHILDPPIQSPSIDPHIFINVAFQRHRFRYRSTMAGSMMWAIQGLDPVGMTTWTNPYPIDFSTPPPPIRPVRQGATTTRSVTRSQRVDPLAVRRNVYSQGLWVRPGTSARFRDCSPEFYRLNPAQTHRLMPWLHRELNVLLDMQHDTETVSRDIINLISAHHINSSAFHRAMTYYLGSTAEHFIHEFYHYAISPHDMRVYDSLAQYAQVGREFSSESDSDIEMLNLPEPLVSLDLTAAPGPSGLQSSSTATEERTTNSPSNLIVIELSDDDDNRAVETDSDVEIIGQLPPRHLRTPEVITILSESETEEQRPVEPKREPQFKLNASSSEEDEEEEEEEEEEEDVIALNPSDDNSSTPAYHSTPSAPCECPMYDNCPFSRKLQLLHNRRGMKRETATSSSVFSSTSSSSSSPFTDDDIDISRPSTSRRKHKKAVINKKKCTTSKINSSENQIGTKRKRSRRSSNHSRDVLRSSTNDDTYTSDDNNSNSNYHHDKTKKKKRRPVRLKSIVLKVDKSKPSTPSGASRYFISRPYNIRDLISDSDD